MWDVHNVGRRRAAQRNGNRIGGKANKRLAVMEPFICKVPQPSLGDEIVAGGRDNWAVGALTFA